MKIETTMKIKVVIQTRKVLYDTEQGYIANYSADCLFNGRLLVSTDFGATYKTEEAAIKALKKLMKNFNE